MNRIFGSRALRFVLALALALGGAACATARGGDDQAVTIRVDNTGAPSRALTVYVLESSGLRQAVGPVPPGRTVTLRYRGPTLGAQYRLLARVSGGGDIVSSPIALSPGGTIVWDIQANLARPVESATDSGQSANGSNP